MSIIFPREIQALHKQILEYLKFAKFENTEECFEHEIKSKIITKQLNQRKIDLMDDDTPELLRLLKGVKKKNEKDRNRANDYKKLQEEYLDLLAAARQLFRLGLRMIDLCESSEDLMAEKKNKALVQDMRDQMVRYHQLILPEIKPKLIKTHSTKRLKGLSKELKRLYSDYGKGEELLQFLQFFRVKIQHIHKN